MTPVTARQTVVSDPEAAAKAAYAELHAALAGHGVCVDLSALAADVTAFGEPVVRLGRTSVEGAFRLANDEATSGPVWGDAGGSGVSRHLLVRVAGGVV